MFAFDPSTTRTRPRARLHSTLASGLSPSTPTAKRDREAVKATEPIPSSEDAMKTSKNVGRCCGFRAARRYGNPWSFESYVALGQPRHAPCTSGRLTMHIAKNACAACRLPHSVGLTHHDRPRRRSTEQFRRPRDLRPPPVRHRPVCNVAKLGHRMPTDPYNSSEKVIARAL